VDAQMVARLGTPEGAAALAAADRADPADPLLAAVALRAAGIAPDLAAAALTQAELRRRAAGKFGADAARMLFTRAGLEQATRSVVAARRAARLAAAGVGSIADLGCGVGAETIALARAGLRVRAVELDPATAAVAAANVAALGLTASVTVGDAQDFDLSTVDAAFCDPARRTGSGRVFDPRSYSPPWSFLESLMARVPRTVLKVAPGLDHRLVPADAEAEWVSVDGEVVEAALWCGPLASARHRATLLPSGSALTGTGLASAPVGPVGEYVYDPDGAVVRSHLVAEFAAQVSGVLADPEIAYVYTSSPVATPFGRRYRVTDVIPFSLKGLRSLLRSRGVGRLTIKKRGSALEPEQLRRQLRLDGPHEATVVLTRVAGRPTVLLCQAE
jgi:SAM-dependent methyltransferase